MTQSHLRLLCVLIVAGFLVVGLWPFNFAPRNLLERLPGENAIRFRPLSLVVSEDVLDLGNTSAPSSSLGTFTLELLLTAEREPNRNLPVILSLYNGELPESLLVGQWKSSLLLRTPARDAQARRKYRETGVEGALQKNRQRFIAITSGPEGTLFYVDGVLAYTYPKVFVRPEDLRGRLILGDSPRGGNGWTGKLFGLAAFNRPLNASEVLRHYRFWTGRRGSEIASEAGVTALFLFEAAVERTIPDKSPSRNALLIPASYYDVHKTILFPPWGGELLHWDDIAINIVGFVPFGFFYFAYWTMLHAGRYFGNALWVILAGGVISAAIELTQVLIPTRDSSFIDLICNILGTVLGVILAAAARKLAGRHPALPGPLRQWIGWLL